MRTLALMLISVVGPSLAACDSEVANHLPGSDPWLDGNVAQFIEFSANADEGPVVMLNLLKFRDQSLDGNGTGVEAYTRYGELAGPFVSKHGGELIWAGATTETLVGDMALNWDMVLLVKWPKRQNLLDLADDPEYEAVAHHRANGLERTMLIALDEQANLLAGQ
jgi:uncharacterized protein (DUF1330 family)